MTVLEEAVGIYLLPRDEIRRLIRHYWLVSEEELMKQVAIEQIKKLLLEGWTKP